MKHGRCCCFVWQTKFAWITHNSHSTLTHSRTCQSHTRYSITSTHKLIPNEWINEFHSKALRTTTTRGTRKNKHPIGECDSKIFCVETTHMWAIIFIGVLNFFSLISFFCECMRVPLMGPPLHCGRIQRKNISTDNKNMKKILGIIISFY